MSRNVIFEPIREGWVKLSPERGKWFFRKGDRFIMTDAFRRDPIILTVAFIHSSGGITGEDHRGGRHSAPPDSDRVWIPDIFSPIARIPGR